ncbi:hypothetical protein, partial [Staphylococcus aureus]|uniref:hypothetical protein n=1 Tax=Staphylococcus aureus TaxID=1280 RepID=UPI001FD08205
SGSIICVWGVNTLEFFFLLQSRGLGDVYKRQHQLRQAALLDELELAAATEDVRQELLLDAALFASTYPAGNGMPPWQEHYRLIPTFRTTRAGAKSRRC